MSVVIPHSQRPLSVKSLEREPGIERRNKESSAILMCEFDRPHADHH